MKKIIPTVPTTNRSEAHSWAGLLHRPYTSTAVRLCLCVLEPDCMFGKSLCNVRLLKRASKPSDLIGAHLG